MDEDHAGEVVCEADDGVLARVGRGAALEDVGVDNVEGPAALVDEVSLSRGVATELEASAELTVANEELDVLLHGRVRAPGVSLRDGLDGLPRARVALTAVELSTSPEVEARG